jgi:hypothetical protein
LSAREDSRACQQRGGQTCQQEKIAEQREARLVSKEIAGTLREGLSAGKEKERVVLSGTRKDEFQQEGNVVCERKGRIVIDGKGWSSAIYIERKDIIFHDRKRKRKGEVGKDWWKRCSIQGRGGSCMKKKTHLN